MLASLDRAVPTPAIVKIMSRAIQWTAVARTAVTTLWWEWMGILVGLGVVMGVNLVSYVVYCDRMTQMTSHILVFICFCSGSLPIRARGSTQFGELPYEFCEIANCRYYINVDESVENSQTSNIRSTKSPKINIFRLVLQSSLSNSLKPGVKSRIKMYLEQRWQLHLSGQQFHCLRRCDLYQRFQGNLY